MDGTMLQSQWGWQIALYLFFGGLGGGTLLVAGLMGTKHDKTCLPATCFGAWAAVVCLCVGVLLLLSEVGMPFRALMMIQSFSNFGSWMTIGAWLLFVGAFAAGTWALAQTQWINSRLRFLVKLQRPLAYAGVVFGALISVYTGILLCVLDSHPLWNTIFLPMLFTLSAFDTGVAIMMLWVSLRERNAHLRQLTSSRLEKATVILVVFETIALIALLVASGTNGDVGSRSVGILINGQLALVFWLVFVAMGLAVPCACALVSLRIASTSEDKASLAPNIDEHDKTVDCENFGEDGFPSKDAFKEQATNEKSLSLASKGEITPVVGGLCCLVGGCALRFLILLAGLPVWA